MIGFYGSFKRLCELSISNNRKFSVYMERLSKLLIQKVKEQMIYQRCNYDFNLQSVYNYLIYPLSEYKRRRPSAIILFFQHLVAICSLR